MELAAGGNNYVGFKAADAVSDSVYTLPAAFPASNKVLQSTDAGVLTWESAAAGVSLANDANDRVTTATGSGGINGEANLTFDGSLLTAPAINLGDENLSDYDEGSFTPVLAGQTTAGSPSYGTQVGRYIRVGNLVHVAAAIVYTDKSTTAGTMRIESLPFTASNVSGMRQGFSIAKFNLINLNVGGGVYQLTLQLVDNQTYGYLTECGDNVTSAIITDADIADTTAIWYTGSYNIV